MKVEISETYHTHWENKKCIQHVGCIISRTETIWETKDSLVKNINVDWREILWDVEVWTGFNCLNIWFNAAYKIFDVKPHA